MTRPTRAQAIEAVRRAERGYRDWASVPTVRERALIDAAALREAVETLAVVEWMQRTNPHAWANQVMWFKQAMEAERKEKERADG